MNMHTTTRILCLGLTLSACQKVVYEGDRLDGDQPCSGDACADRTIATGSYVPGREAAEDAARVAVEVACERLYSDCASLCKNEWVFCGSSQEQCVEDYVRAVVEDMTYPVSSQPLAEACANQLETRSCQDLDPNSAYCDLAVVEGCPSDDDAYGKPYSWLAATPIDALPKTLDLHICDGVEEWFAVHLDEGEELIVVREEGVEAWIELYEAVVVDGAPIDVNHMESMLPDDGDPEKTFAAVHSSTTYYVQVNAVRGTGGIRLSFGTNRRKPPTYEEVASTVAADVYEKICARLHSDCASLCNSGDFYCGTNVDECKQAFAASSIAVRGSSDEPITRSAADQCVTDLQATTCDALVPSTADCATIVKNPCPDDPLGWGRPYSWRLASTRGPLPQTLGFDICDDSSAWVKIELAAGDELKGQLPEAPAAGWVNMRLYPETTPAADLDDESGWLTSTSVDVEYPSTVEAAPVAGSYFVQIEHVSASGPIRITLSR